MKSMFEQIDDLEPIVPQDILDAMNTAKHNVWKLDHPEEHQAIMNRFHDKEREKRRNRKGGRDGDKD